MSDKSSLEEAIIADLEKTGYPTEIIAAAIMERRNWMIAHNPSYVDDSEGQSREFDIRAYRKKDLMINGKDFALGYYLITECKKSLKPWVFFTTEESYIRPRLGSVIKSKAPNKLTLFTNYHNPESLVPDDTLRKFHHYFQQQRLARTFYEPLKGQEKSGHSQMIYSAVMSAIKATLFLANDQPIESWLRVFYPLIVFSGDLFEARVNAAKKIDLLRTQYIQLSFNYVEPQKKPDYRLSFVWERIQEFFIDIVHEDYLNQFLDEIENEQVILANHIAVRNK